MKTHAVKEIILDCLLCVEMDPQPPEVWRYNPDLVPIAPIAIGDTVYRGDEWVDKSHPENIDLPPEFIEWIDAGIVDPDSEKCKAAFNKLQAQGADVKVKTSPPETMPIELADKTYRVVGIEVKEMDVHRPPNPPSKVVNENWVKKWFWNYKLKEIA